MCLLLSLLLLSLLLSLLVLLSPLLLLLLLLSLLLLSLVGALLGMLSDLLCLRAELKRERYDLLLSLSCPASSVSILPCFYCLYLALLLLALSHPVSIFFVLAKVCASIFVVVNWFQERPLPQRLVVGWKTIINSMIGCVSFGQDSEQYVDKLLELFNRFSNLVKEAFNDDPRFLTSRDMVGIHVPSFVTHLLLQLAVEPVLGQKGLKNSGCPL